MSASIAELLEEVNTGTILLVKATPFFFFNSASTSYSKHDFSFQLQQNYLLILSRFLFLI